jgi:DNA-binding NarL/FixJ family response regulator
MTTKQRRSLARPARILIVDDHPMMRAGLAAQIEDEPDLEVCAQAEDVNDALAAVKSTSLDLAIIDIALKEDHGINLVKHIKSRFPGVKMLVLSAYQESLYAERALRAGAMGYLNKQETGEKMFEAIRTVLAGERYLSSEMTKRLVAQAFGAADATMTSPVESLSNRELEVFQLIGEGLTAAAIARRLHVSPHTIDSHREKIKQKLDVKTANEIQREATQWILENG